MRIKHRGNARMDERTTSVAIGRYYEDLAARHVERHDLRIVDKNFRCKLGEIDLIALDPRERLVFIEVRYRTSHRFGGALASVTTRKQLRLRRAAQVYLKTHREYQHHYCRFDVVGIEKASAQASEVTINWIKSAFY